MKLTIALTFGATAALLLTLAASSQDTLNPRTDPDRARERMPQMLRSDRIYGASKASDVIGATVKNYQDEKLGKVNDLAVDVQSGRVIQVILSTGGVLGVGDTLTAVPPGALHYDAAQKVVHLDATKDRLQGAPRFENAKWAECCDSNHLAAVYGYYGQEPAFRFVHKGDEVFPDRRNADSRVNRVDSPNTDFNRRGEDTPEQERVWRERQFMVPEARLAHVQKASKLMGTTVKNRQDEKIGTVNNLLVDLTSGRIVAVILSSGGFLGMGDDLNAVPPTALRYVSDRDSLQFDTTKEQLSQGPRFKADQWPDFSEPSYSYGVYRAYKVEPYFTTNKVTDVDNSKVNVRDRRDQTLTPLDQGNSKSDLETTAQIRKQIVAEKNISVNAKNVKVITSNGRVTLRGPVNSEEEKRILAEIAARVATPDSVDNQLEVKRGNPGNE